jgi:outer membrane protein OmpA-like peptidoglycan-associated protein
MKLFSGLLVVLVFEFTFFSHTANANICGTDYQNFNPTTNGIDFVTVQSSETIRPCFINLGVFADYAANSLTYTNAANAALNGQKQNDRILSGDVSFGMGITDRWDFGVNVPSMLNQTVSDANYGSTFVNEGITEIKVNTKYRFLGDNTHGLAGIFSINENMIQNNPFAGSGAGPTLNFEVAADWSLGNRWATAVNAGYRKRDPGSQIPNVPFVPLKDQWIYSAAASYLFSNIDTKLIFEIYGSKAAQTVDQATDRSMDALEGLLGVKHDFSNSFAGHLGATAQLDSSLGGPEWRVYAGFNYSFGPICKTAPRVEKGEGTRAQVYKLNVSVLFANDSDVMDEELVGELNTFFSDLMKKKFSKIEVSGHTDSVGSRDYNIDLSQRRAANIRKYLIEKFKIDPKKLESAGYGPDYPVANNGNYQGRHQNRRVEFKVWP